jgi:hypothetical protein
MKPLVLTVLFLLLFIPCRAQEKVTQEFSPADLELTVSDVKKTKTTLEIEITLKNKGSKGILTVSPIIADDFKTNYFLGFNDENKTLQVRRHFFSYPNYITDTPDPCYALFIVEAGKGIREKFVLGYPMAINSYLFGLKTDISKYDKFNVQIGVLPFDDTIYRIREKRPFGQCVMPDDKIESGIYRDKTLIETQQILSANAN